MEVTLGDALQTVFAAATTNARQRKRRLVSLELVVLALLDLQDVRTVLERCGADPADIRRELDEYLDLLEPERGGLTGSDDACSNALNRAAIHARAAGRAIVETSPNTRSFV